jgi:hypothetical protein
MTSLMKQVKDSSGRWTPGYEAACILDSCLRKYNYSSVHYSLSIYTAIFAESY